MNFKWVLLFVCSVAAFDWDEPTELDEYVHYDDGYFSWTELAHYEIDDMDLYMLNMTSQKWMNESFSSASIWYHEMGVAIPKDIEFEDAGFLTIIGGNNDPDFEPRPPNSTENFLLRWFVNRTNTVTAWMRQVPNQPVVFPGDPEQASKREDDYIAWTWIEAERVNGTVPQMVARFPMTKAAKRALDAMNELVMEKTGNNITRFHVGGPSKRGWTTWSLAMMDRRIISFSPLVYSLLHFEETLMHHYQSLNGAWSFALGPYWNVNLTCLLLDPLASILYDYEDPYRYRERLDQPKLVISGTADEFFLLTDSHHWWDDIPGQSWFMMNPNADHILLPHWFNIAENLVAFWRAILNDYEIPTLSWTRTQEEGVGGTVTVTTSEPPMTAIAFISETVDNGTRRDFRLLAGAPGEQEPQDVRWIRDNVTQLDETTFEHTHYEIEGKWTGHFIQVEFEGPEGYNYRFTSEVNVLPDTFPAEPCGESDSMECCGYLT